MKKNTFVNILQGLFYIALVGAAAFGIYYLFENKFMQEPTPPETEEYSFWEDVRYVKYCDKEENITLDYLLENKYINNNTFNVKSLAKDLGASPDTTSYKESYLHIYTNDIKFSDVKLSFSSGNVEDFYEIRLHAYSEDYRDYISLENDGNGMVQQVDGSQYEELKDTNLYCITIIWNWGYDVLGTIKYGLTGNEEDTPGTNDNEPVQTPEEQITDNKVIFNEHFAYQGFIEYDSTELSSISESIVGEYVDEAVMNSGVDLKKMADCIVGDLTSTTAEAVTMLIYFDKAYDTTNMFFDIDGVDQIILYGENAEESFEINLRYSEITNIDVNSFMDKISMITIVCNDYERLESTGGTLVSRY